MKDTVTVSPFKTGTPPRAARKPIEIEQLGIKRTDAYHWLKDPDWQRVMKDPSRLQADIRAYLEAENAYTKTHLEDPLETLRASLFEEMRGRIKEDDFSLPQIDGPYAYFTRYLTGKEYPILARCPADQAYKAAPDEEVLLDGNQLAEGKPYFAFNDIVHSPDHTILAYAIDDQGSEFYTIYFKDLASGAVREARIEGTHGDFVWGAHSDRIFWVARNETGRPCAVFMYTLSDGVSTEIYREDDPSFFVSLGESQSGAFIFIGAGTHVISEWRFFAADAVSPAPQLIAGRALGVDYTPEHWGDQLVILTNADSAVDFKIVTAPLSDAGPENWTDLVPHQAGTLILGLEAVKSYLVRTERKDGLPQIVVRDLGGNEHVIAFDEAAYNVSADAGYLFDTDTIRLSYSSLTRPTEIYDYDLTDRTRVLRKTQTIPSGHDPGQYITERRMAPARDGQTIPVTLLRHKSTPLDGSAPVMLYAYGAYGITIDAGFHSPSLSLVDRGMIYAIAHPRGSMAKGYQWYLDGKLSLKENTFNDYVDAARDLIAHNYTQAGRIVGSGGSAGGLLMGAVANQAPDLFAGIVAMVPFVDTLNTMSDDTLPLTPIEWPEWGNPLSDADDYRIIAGYSPYDNVADRAYPPMLITGGISDPRVTYWEPAKWIAKLRDEAPSSGPYFLKTNMEAGHGGASGRFEALKERALNYAFALRCVGRDE
ncbi:MAG: S9 family peptidase [Pseudomonadota bacterium]